jgi:hypothetical protein
MSIGNMLNGIYISIKTEYSGLKLDRRLCEYRKELNVKPNLKGIVFARKKNLLPVLVLIE